MKRNRIFADPNPNFKFEPIASPDSEYEAAIATQIDPLEEDPIKNLAGLIIRSAVDIARYKRSAWKYPEKSEHFQRLTRTTEYMAQMRTLQTIESASPNVLTELQHTIEEIDWSSAEYVPKINHVDKNTPLEFTPSFTAWYNAGGMDEAIMQPGEASRASFCCGGGVHSEDRPAETY